MIRFSAPKPIHFAPRRHTRGLRCSVIALTATCLAAAGAVAILPTSPAAADVTAPAIDLADPAATVNDPIASLAPVNTECGQGQVDLNTASAAQLSAALNLPSSPTIARLMAMRPWLKGADLSSVPGIGPDVAAALAPGTCATQPVLPPPTPLACTSGSQVDLQAAPVATISSRLKLPLNAARALAAARPLPQDLTQMITPRVPGLSGPTLSSLLATRSICVTPAPMLARGSAWRWATPAGGAVVTRDGYGLIVPPGRVTSPAGAYVSVTPLPDGDGVVPRLDAHIWGDWNSGTTTVAIQGPWVGAGDPSMAPVIIHDSSDRGVTASTGDAVAVSTVAGRPTVTGLEYSLSTSSIGAASCTPTSNEYGGSTLCANELADGSLHDAWLADAQRAADAANRIKLSANPSCGDITTPTYSIASLGKLPFGVSCYPDGPASDNSATWRMSDDASKSVRWGIAHLGVVYHYAVHDGTSTSTASGNGEGDTILRAAEAVLTNHVPFLFPGQTLTVTKPRDSGDTRVDMAAAPGATGTWAGALDAIDAVGGYFSGVLDALQPGAAEQMFSDCVPNLDSEFAGCVKDQLSYYLNLALTTNQQTIDAGRPPLLSKARAAALSTAKRALTELSIGEWLTNFGTALVISAGDGNGVLLRNVTLNAAPRAGSGGLGAGDSYIARDPGSARAVLVKPDGSVLDIPNGGTFQCLAETWLVWDNPGVPALSERTDGTATCVDAGPRTWHVAPASAGGNIPDNVILREYKPDAGTNPQAAWLINSSSAVQSIPDGGTYLCLAYANAVIWDVRYAAVAAWQPVGTTAASCG